MNMKPNVAKLPVANGPMARGREGELAKLAASSKSLGEFIDAASDLCLTEEDKAFLSKMSPRWRKRARAMSAPKTRGQPR
jgi:hypothetical protein